MSVRWDWYFGDQHLQLMERWTPRLCARISVIAESLHSAAKVGSTLSVRQLLRSLNEDATSSGFAVDDYARRAEPRNTVLRWKDEDWGATALHYASIYGHADVVSQLLEVGEETYVDVLDRTEQTALHRASRHGHVNVVRVLLGKGCNVNLVKQFNQTALFLAADAGHLDIVKLLLEHGCDLNLPDQYLRTPLHRTAIGNHAEVARLLMQEEKCLIDVADIKNCTALHAAAVRGHTEMVKLLVENGAALDLEESLSKTALYFSAERDDCQEMTEFLLEKRATFTSRHLATGKTYKLMNQKLIKKFIL